MQVDRVSTWTEYDKKSMVAKMETLLGQEKGKISQTKLVSTGLKAIPEDKRYAENTIPVSLRKIWRALSPYITDDIRARAWGKIETGEVRIGAVTIVHDEDERFPVKVEKKGESVFEGSVNYTLLYTKIREAFFLEFAEILPSEITRLVDERLALMQTGKEQARTSAPSALKKPRVAIFGLPTHQHESLKLQPFRKVLDIRFHVSKATSDAKQVAENCDLALVMVQHFPNTLLKEVKAGANGRVVMVQGGTSALECALHVVCVDHKIPVTISDKAHEEIRGVH